MRWFLPFARFSYFAAALLLVGSVATHAQAAAAATAAPAASGAPTPAAKRLSVSGIHNAGKVTDFLYRGAQPSKESFAELKKLGVTTVVDLREGRNRPKEERKEVESLQMRYVYIPVSGWAPPRNAQVAEFLTLFKNNEQGQKVFVHCHFGDDRTGVMVATYRIAIEHWTVEQAIQEMHSFGFHYHWHPKMEAYVRNFPSALAKDPVFGAFRSNPEQK